MDQERRRSFRCTVAEEGQPALLRVRQADVPVRLLDESASGFRIVSDEKVPVKEGQTLLLGTTAGWHTIRVVRLDRTEKGLLLGLERIGDLPVALKGLGFFATLWGAIGPRSGLFGWKALLSGVALASIVGVMVFCWVEMNPFGLGWAPTSDPSDRSGTASPFASDAPSRDGEARGSGFSFRSLFGGGRTRSRAVKKRLRRVGTLTSSSVKDWLGLTSQQQEEIDRILTQTSQTLARGTARGKDVPKWEEELTRGAESRLLDVLTDEQKEKWRGMVRSSD